MRPKPEYGTVELRVLDTPLRPAHAAALASYARELCVEAFGRKGEWPSDSSRELYAWNRFNAAKDGIEAIWINPETGARLPVSEVVENDLQRLAAVSLDPGFATACDVVRELMAKGGQARWLTAHMETGSGVNDIARVASEMFDLPDERVTRRG